MRVCILQFWLFLWLAIASYKVQFWGRKRLICSQNCEFISHNSDLITHNSEFLSQYSERNSELFFHNCKFISYNIDFRTCNWVYIMQFWEKKVRTASLHLAILTSFLRIQSLYLAILMFFLSLYYIILRKKVRTARCKLCNCEKKVRIVRSRNYFIIIFLISDRNGLLYVCHDF